MARAFQPLLSLLFFGWQYSEHVQHVEKLGCFPQCQDLLDEDNLLCLLGSLESFDEVVLRLEHGLDRPINISLQFLIR